MDDIITAQEVAAILKISKSQVYELTNEKTRTGGVRKNPIPAFRLGTTVRFRKGQVAEWLAGLSEQRAA